MELHSITENLGHNVDYVNQIIAAYERDFNGDMRMVEHTDVSP